MTVPPLGLHRGARLEDAVKERAGHFLRRRGWIPQVVPYPGYGSTPRPATATRQTTPTTPVVPGTPTTPDDPGDQASSAESLAGPAAAGGWVRVLARVRLGPPEGGFDDSIGSRWWRKFFTVAVADLPVSVRIGDRIHQVRSGRGGYLDAVLAADLAPGWHEVRFGLGGSARSVGPIVHERIRVVGPEERLGLLSDIDDTVMVTALPRPLLAFWNTFVVKETNRRPVPGMAELYRRLRAEEPDAVTIYLSTGAWNVARPITRFLDRHGYPRGALLMTDWGPTTESWFRSGQAHKRRELLRLVRDFPQLQWVLVGDDGQHDPQLYDELVTAAPAAVRMVLIRQLTAVEQVLTHGTALPPTGAGGSASRPVRWLQGIDGASLAAQLDSNPGNPPDFTAYPGGQPNPGSPSAPSSS